MYIVQYSSCRCSPTSSLVPPTRLLHQPYRSYRELQGRVVVDADLPDLVPPPWLLHQPYRSYRELQGRVVVDAHLPDLVPPHWLLHQPYRPYPELQGRVPSCGCSLTSSLVPPIPATAPTPLTLQRASR